MIFLNIATICSFSFYVLMLCMYLSLTSSMSQWQDDVIPYFPSAEAVICHSKTKVKERIYIYATPPHIKTLGIGQNRSTHRWCSPLNRLPWGSWPRVPYQVSLWCGKILWFCAIVRKGPSFYRKEVQAQRFITYLTLLTGWHPNGSRMTWPIVFPLHQGDPILHYTDSSNIIYIKVW